MCACVCAWIWYAHNLTTICLCSGARVCDRLHCCACTHIQIWPRNMCLICVCVCVCEHYTTHTCNRFRKPQTVGRVRLCRNRHTRCVLYGQSRCAQKVHTGSTVETMSPTDVPAQPCNLDGNVIQPFVDTHSFTYGTCGTAKLPAGAQQSGGSQALCLAFKIPQ